MKTCRMVLLVFFLVVGIATTSSATLVDFTFTGDNVVAAWWQDGSSPVDLLGSYSGNLATWQQADTISVDLAAGDTYDVIWEVTDDADGWYTAGFLAQIEWDGNTVLTSNNWEVAVRPATGFGGDFSALAWAFATPYGSDGTSPWTTNVTAIDDSAQWIWTDNNKGDEQNPIDSDVFIKTSITLASVPEPTTLLLLGFGLLGLVGLRRKE